MKGALSYRNLVLAAVLLMLCCCWVAGAMAQTVLAPWEQVWPKDTTPVSVGDTLTLRWNEPVRGTVSFGLTDVIILRNDPYSQDSTLVPKDVRLTLHIIATTNPDHGNYVKSLDSDTLIVADLQVGMRGAELFPAGLDSALAVQDAAAMSFFEAHELKIILQAVEVDTGSGWNAASAMPKGLVLEGSISMAQEPEVDLGFVPANLACQWYDCTGNHTEATAQELEFSWGLIPGMEEYDVEWTWVDDYRAVDGLSTGLRPTDQIEYDLERDATRVSVPGNKNSYRVPLLYDRGWIVWRVRGSVHSSVPPTSAWLHGAWSNVPAAGSVQVALTVDPANAKHVPAHQIAKNWQASSSFAEGGKHKEVVTYADGSLRSRQVVTRNNTLGAPIVGETVYDATGRAAVQVMPVPKMDTGCVVIGTEQWAPITYKPKFNQEDSLGNHKPFTWADLTLTGTDCSIAGPKLDSISGAQFYYSGAYSAADPSVVLGEAPSFLPRAEGMPYSLTEYTRDNTGRIRAQGGVGPKFQSGQRDTRYFYGRPSQIELDRLFGSEAGYAQHYQKNVTVDPNKQVSVTYLDMAGHTVATALACGAPEGMDPVGTGDVMLTSDLFNGLASTDTSIQLRLDGPSLVFTTQLAIGCDGGSYSFDYHLDTLVLRDTCWTICAHCVYDLDIALTDMCGDPVFSTSAVAGSLDMAGGAVVFRTACDPMAPPPANNYSHTEILAAGEYTLTKTLRIHAAARDYYVSQLLSTTNNACALDSAHFAEQALATLDTSGCNVTCAECYASIGSLETFTGNGGTAEQYAILLADCDAQCKPPSWCDVAYANMLADVYLNGQYGRTVIVQQGGNEVYTAPEYTSVFHDVAASSQLRIPFLTNPTGEAWRIIDPSLPLWRQPLMETATGWENGYYDSNGRTKVFVELLAGGGYEPAVVDPSLVFTDGPNSYYTWPENLAALDDFLHEWHAGWERSLVRFHPEYCYYRDCKGYSVLTDPDLPFSSSDAFDARLNNAENYADATSTLNGPALISSGTPAVFNYLALDPFAYSGDVYASDLQDRVDNYVYMDGQPYSMLQLAAAVVEGGGDLGAGLVFGNSTDPDILDQEWATLRGFYQSEKYRIQKHKADNFVSDCGCAGMNVCIGETHWQTWWDRMHPPYTSGVAWWDAPGNLYCQPCNTWRHEHFSDKFKRVPEPDQIGGGADAMDAAYQVYVQTGQCPVGSAWKVLLEQLLANGEFDPNGTYSLNDYSGWQGVYTALNDLEPVAQCPTATAHFSQSGNTLTMTVVYTDGTPDCVITFTYNGGGVLHWDAITHVAQLNAGTDPGEFTLGIYYTDGGGISNTMLQGTGMCQALAPCNFPPQCEPNDLAMQFQGLFNLLAEMGELNGYMELWSTTAPPGATGLPSVQATIGASVISHFNTGAQLSWGYDNSVPQLLLMDVNDPGTHFRLDDLVISDATPAALTVDQCMAQAAYFHNITSAFANNFTVDVDDVNGDLLCRLSGKAWFDVNGTSEPLPFGHCGQPPTLACQGAQYQVVQDLVDVLADWIPAHSPDFNGVNLWESPYMTTALALALCSECDSTWQGLTAHMNGNNVEIGDCLEFNVGTPAPFDALGEATFIGAPTPEGAYPGLSFDLLLDGAVVGSLSVEASCLDLLECEDCPQDTTGTSGTATMALAMLADSTLRNMGLVHADTLWAGYAQYKQAIDSLNFRMGLAPGDSSYVQADNYPTYRKMGMPQAVDVYLRYIRNFRPEIDRSILLHRSGKFVKEYGNTVNVDKEYKRYVRVVEDYNTRADSAGKPHLELLPDSVFREMLVADKVADYIANVVDMPPLDDPPLSMAEFYSLSGDSTPDDACANLYLGTYLPAYKWFESHNSDSTARCPDYLKYSPLVSLNEFRASNLCCSDSGQALLGQYVQQLYSDTLKCPGALPRLKECPEPLEKMLVTEEKECQDMYVLWVDAMKAYADSQYYAVTGYELTFEDISFETFQNEGWCKCVQNYLNYIQPYLEWIKTDPELPMPLHIKDFCNKPCENSHRDWLGLMEEYNHPCKYVEVTGNYLPVGDLEDYGHFAEQRLCDCVEAYMVYLQPYLQWNTGTPPAAPITIQSFCSGDSIDCCTLVDSLKRVITKYYPLSAYQDTFHYDLRFTWSGCAEMEELGLCECLPAYLAYLDAYLAWTPDSASLPRPQDLEEFCTSVGLPSDCENSYAEYENGLLALSDLLATVNSTYGTNMSFAWADITLFTSAGLCYCVDGYLADLELALTQALADEANLPHLTNDKGVLNIIYYCVPPTPCPPPPLYPVTPNIPLPPQGCVCCQEQLTAAILGAQGAYQQYVDTLVQDLTARYDSACLTALETLTMTGPNSEHHYTLYYYDQAGNLVRTVPPEGVELLPITAPGDPDEVAITADRANGTHTVFTSHRMASDHLYNSLEQPVRSAMPDQDDMAIWGSALPAGLPTWLQITGSWFGAGGIGYLTGYRVLGSTSTRGYAYRTADGGETWARSFGLLGDDLLDVYFPTANLGFAVGTHGAFVKTVDGGASWDLMPNELLGGGHDNTAVMFNSATDGIVLSHDGFAAFTADAGETFPSLASVPGTPVFTGVGYDGTDYQASASAYAGFPNGAVLSVPPAGTPWDVTGAFGTVATDYSCLAAFGPDTVRAGGAHGVLIENNAGTEDQWRMLPTGTADGFKALAFLNGTRGVAIMDSLHNGTSTGVLRYTCDHGRTWLPIGRPAFDLNVMAEYERTATTLKLVAVGNGGTVVRVIMDNDTVGIIPMSGVSANIDLSSVWAARTGSLLRCIAGSTTGEVLGTTSLDYGQQATWVTLHNYTVPIIGLTGAEVADVVRAVVLTGTQRADMEWDLTATPGFTQAVATDNSTAVTQVNAGTATLYNPGNATFLQVVMSGPPPFSTTGPATPAGTPPVQAPMAILPTSTGIWSVGSGGELFKAAGTGPNAWMDQSAVVRPLPLRAMDKSGTVAVGDQGLVYQNTGGAWRSVPTGHLSTLRGVGMDAGIAAVVGDTGTAFIFDPATSTILHELEAPVTSDLYAVAVHGTKLTLGGTNGIALYTPDHTATVPDFTVLPYNAGTLRAAAYTSTFSGLLAVGDGALVHAFVGANRWPVQDVFTPKLNSVDFTGGTEGYVVGDKLTARHTLDGGLHWRTVPLPAPVGVPDLAPLNAVKMLPEGGAWAVGDGGRSAEFSGDQWTSGIPNLSPGTTDLTALAVAPSGAAVITGENGTSTGGYFRLNAGGTTWTSVTTGIPALHAVWNFPRIGTKDEFIVGGQGGFMRRLVFPNGVHGNDVPSSISGAGDIRAFWFHDHVAGFAATDAGELYRTDPENTADHLTFGWAATLPMNDQLDGITQTAWQPATLGFSDRHHGFIGGHYASGTPERYARTLTDETGLYSQRFWYDALGRIILSQNTKQFSKDTALAPQRYSYTLYDDLGRVYEAGEVDDDITPRFNTIAGTLVGGAEQPSVLDPDTVRAWVLLHVNPTLPTPVINRREVTRTWYDEALPGITSGLTGLTQDNLRLRVATTTFQQVYNPDSLVYDHATHYSYDIHGNVKALVQDIPQMGLDADGTCQLCPSQRFKRLDYTYDLISGNVLKVDYQRGRKDQMHHRYTYDADNRIQEVETSVDNVIWHVDADYFYYPHGPLQRVELGQHKVQGMDYAYTLQGWLKGINSDRLYPMNDMGRDGVNVASNPNGLVGRDAFGQSIGYYGDEDYKAIDAVRWGTPGLRPFATVGTTGTLSSAYTPLYNGNIAHTVQSLSPFAGYDGTHNHGQVLAQVYRYDQLNRLKKAQGVEGLTAANTWNGVQDPVPTRFRSTYAYDANGNILQAHRWNRFGNRYDSLYYRYQTNTAGDLVRNRLYQLMDMADVVDTIANDVHDLPFASTDINDQTDALGHINNGNNYSYDELGNLKGDLREEIQNIAWTVAGKVKSIGRTAGSTKPDLAFTYGADGQRIGKTVGNPDQGGFREHYIRDAQGNIMASYLYKSASGTGATMLLRERPIYGSKRIGSYAEEEEMVGAGLLPANYTHPMQTQRERYELTDHLGNVAAVVTGRLLNGANSGAPKQAELISAQGYEPFGSLLPGRNYNAGTYRWGFNGKENDNEVFGATGTFQDYGMRAYDPRIARFISVDPITAKYPMLSPYQFASNTPIQAIDVDGLEAAVVGKNNPFLIIFIQGRADVGGDQIVPERTQYGNIPKQYQTDGGLMTIGSDDFNFKSTIIQFSGSDDETTSRDVAQTIKNYRTTNPEGKVVLVGHSVGGKNAIEAALMVAHDGEIKNKTIDLLITMEPAKVIRGGLAGRAYTNKLENNVRTAINYNGATGGYPGIGGTLSNGRSASFSLGPGTDHQNMDNTLTPLIPLLINLVHDGDDPLPIVKHADYSKLMTLPND